MSELTVLSLAFLAGVALGGFHFGSLWWTVRRVSVRQHTGFWLLVGFLTRTAVTLTGFFLLMGGRWERIAVCLVGFLFTRTVLIWRWRPTTALDSTR